ncbi:MAG TPA: DUF1574 family protein [Gemmataceae bacterium]|nr:DUF1574 family protein [Gemmataceae bacterium]
MHAPTPWPKRIRLGRRASHTLFWGALCFVAAQLCWIGLLEWRRPEFFDPKYGCRLNQLRACLTKEPGRALMIVLGSSRSEQGFRPSLLPADTPGGKAPLVYNLARGGSSPLLHLLTLRRLLADGIRPDWVLLEVFPPSLAEDDTSATLLKTTLRDFPLLCHYSISRKTYAYYLRDRALLWWQYRNGLLAGLGPGWLSPSARWDRLWDPRSGEWRTIGESVTPGQFQEELADAGRRYRKKLQDFRIAAEADRALRAILELCREQNIRTLLYLMPEASAFREWYAPSAQALLSNYLAQLGQEYGSPVIDCRGWVQDDDFWDGHHLLYRGAVTFMRRFYSEVFTRPLTGLGSQASRAP